MSSQQLSKGRQKKSASKYEAEIQNLYNEIQLLEAYCLANPEDLETKKEVESKRGYLKRRVQKWAERCHHVIYVANNEQKPWKTEEFHWVEEGEFLETQPMPIKRKVKINGKEVPQVGDYVCYMPEYNVYYPR